jgi:hypothetical protein
MAAKSPFDFSEMTKLYDPERIAKLFDPKSMFEQLPAMQSSAVDMAQIIERNQRGFDAMVEANKAAAASYRDMMEKQMEIFNQLTRVAGDYAANVDTSGSAEAAKRNMDIYSKAIEKAFGLMQKMAESGREANQKAFESIQKQVMAAAEELKTK